MGSEKWKHCIVVLKSNDLLPQRYASLFLSICLTSLLFFLLMSAVPAVRGRGTPPVVWPNRKHVGVRALQEAGAGRLPQTPFLRDCGDRRGSGWQELGGQPGHQPVTYKPPKTVNDTGVKVFYMWSRWTVELVGPWMFPCHSSWKHGRFNFLRPPPRPSDVCLCCHGMSLTQRNQSQPRQTRKRLGLPPNPSFLALRALTEELFLP